MTDPADDLLWQARALINQAVAEAAAQGKSDIHQLYFVAYPAEEVTLEIVRAAIDTMRQATPAGSAKLHFAPRPALRGRRRCMPQLRARGPGHSNGDGGGIGENCGVKPPGGLT